jgi:Rrf2 family protein
MQLTRAADYAVRVTMHLATLPTGEHVSRSLLAAATGVPDSFLSKILQTLSRAGLLISRRGGEGGFAILPSGRNASLLDVIEAIDGPIALNVCLLKGTACDNKSWCPAHLVWTQAQQAMLDVLSSAKIAELSAQAMARKSAAENAIGTAQSALSGTQTGTRILGQATSGNRRSRSKSRNK